MTLMATDSEHRSQCALCGGALSKRFDLTVLYKYEVAYLECAQCLSLQTDFPHWIGEAYSQNLSSLDTGAAQRNLHNSAACYVVAKMFGLNNAVDIGGGDGLLCRLLRDHRINCFVTDKYARPTYAQGFTEPDFTTPDLVISFEVLEHFQNPGTDLEELFRLKPKVLLVSTAIYKKQDKDWWYLSPESGQHLFFYSREAIEFIGRKYGYQFVISSGYILFARQGLLGSVKAAVLKVLLNWHVCLRLLKPLVVLLPTSGHWNDRNNLLKQKR